MSLAQTLGQFGVNPSEVDGILTPLESFVRDAGDAFNAIMQNVLDDNGANASLLLRQSLRPEITKTSEGIDLQFTTDVDYWEFRDRGVSGTERNRDTPFSFKSDRPSKAMAQSIEEWIRAKGFTAPSWAVATNVLRNGYDGVNYVDAAFNDNNMNTFNEQLLRVVDNATRGIIEKVVPEFK